MKKIIININNDITIYTLKKVYRTQNWHQEILDYKSEDNQFLENLDNGFITSEALKYIIDDIFCEKDGYGFRNSLSNCFGNRKRIRFIKSKLEELYNE